MTAAGPRSSGWFYGPWPDLLLGCGLLLEVDGDFAEAAAQFERSASLRPRPLAYERLIHVYERLGDAEGVRRTRQRLVAIRGDVDTPEETATRGIH